jgi:hypothetical protein
MYKRRGDQVPSLHYLGIDANDGHTYKLRVNGTVGVRDHLVQVMSAMNCVHAAMGVPDSPNEIWIAGKDVEPQTMKESLHAVLRAYEDNDQAIHLIYDIQATV